jgi:hypothetical protein
VLDRLEDLFHDSMSLTDALDAALHALEPQAGAHGLEAAVLERTAPRRRTFRRLHPPR